MQILHVSGWSGSSPSESSSSSAAPPPPPPPPFRPFKMRICSACCQTKKVWYIRPWCHAPNKREKKKTRNEGIYARQKGTQTKTTYFPLKPRQQRDQPPTYMQRQQPRPSRTGRRAREQQTRNSKQSSSSDKVLAECSQNARTTIPLEPATATSIHKTGQRPHRIRPNRPIRRARNRLDSTGLRLTDRTQDRTKPNQTEPNQTEPNRTEPKPKPKPKR